jgi:HAMP domain-containing protein
MPRQKKTSRVLEHAEMRVSGLQAINPGIDFGNQRSLQNMMDLTEQLRSRIASYNTALTTIDSTRSEIDTLEKSLNELADQMLIGVAFTYGKDSPEYEMAGGVRKSDRIRRSAVSRLKGQSTLKAKSSL